MSPSNHHHSFLMLLAGRCSLIICNSLVQHEIWFRLPGLESGHLPVILILGQTVGVVKGSSHRLCKLPSSLHSSHAHASGSSPGTGILTTLIS